jgi:hypothetical protein
MLFKLVVLKQFGVSVVEGVYLINKHTPPEARISLKSSNEIVEESSFGVEEEWPREKLRSLRS